MRRLIALLVGAALVASAGQVSALHTHVYTDHDHPEHHHGPAAHDHHAVEVHADLEVHAEGETPGLESCDPGRHSVSLALGCAAVPDSQPLVADCGTPVVIPHPHRSDTIAPLTDVRVHGPPAYALAAPRAPPLSLQA